ncbi:hypothetical protein ACNKHM_11245 [Shigella sonnei]
MTFRNCLSPSIPAHPVGARCWRVTQRRECQPTLREVHRFNNGLHSQNGYVTWNVDSLESAIRLGLKQGVRGRDSYR